MVAPSTLVWFRGKELRVDDHAPLREAAERGDAIPLFVLDPYFFAPERARPIAHRIQFLLDSLVELEAAIARLGSRLLIVRGRSVDVVPALARRLRVDRVVAQRWVEPFGRERDRRIAAALGDIPFELFEGETLHPLGTLRTKTGRPYHVFTPFARAFFRDVRVDPPLPRLRKLPPLPGDVRVKTVPCPTIESLGIPRNPRLPRAGARAARARLKRFLDGPAAEYDEGRDRLGKDGTSRLSADLKFGTISPRTVWTAAQAALAERHPAAWRRFATELIWREFTHALLWEEPDLLDRPFRREFAGFPWRSDAAGWRAWVAGATGYPVVDAAARQLLAEGFVHNRARMISACFLAKDLLVDFRRGERHYLDHLVDGDWAQNDFGWQWSAGCGADAQPWFRIFNPVTQGDAFDPDGAYVRRWVPELARLPDEHIHAPWLAPAVTLAAAGVRLGETYPRPVVEHAAARARFLDVARRHLARRKRQAPDLHASERHDR